MSAFFWTSGHLGWGLFAMSVFTGLWWLSCDVYWRVQRTSIRRLLVTLALGWMIGALLILLLL